METTRALTPCSASRAFAFTASSTSEPVAKIVTFPLSSMRMKAFGAKLATGAAADEDEIPEAWWTANEETLGVPLPRHMSDDPEPEVAEDERMRADLEGDRIVDEARALFLR